MPVRHASLGLAPSLLHASHGHSSAADANYRYDASHRQNHSHAVAMSWIFFWAKRGEGGSLSLSLSISISIGLSSSISLSLIERPASQQRGNRLMPSDSKHVATIKLIISLFLLVNNVSLFVRPCKPTKTDHSLAPASQQR